MLGKCFSAAVIGIDAFTVEIEANLTGTNSAMRESPVSIVGLPDAAVRESRDRVFSAFMTGGFVPPRNSIVVNLAPADLPKEGAAFDLGIALGILGGAGELDTERLREFAAVGELALDGTLRPVRGVLPIADELARGGKVKALVVPRENAREAAFAAGGRIAVYSAGTLAEAVELIRSGKGIAVPPQDLRSAGTLCPLDFADVKGQSAARRTLEIAAAGGHNTLLIGPPGTGKSMLASRLPGILPPMTLEETLETSRIHSVLGMLSSGCPVLNDRPFRSPHHTISDAGLIGGGHNPKPGEISLAHNGVLFLDEFPEFKRSALEALRQPLENGIVTVSRASGSCSFPAKFVLCAAMNPCPCGRGDAELGCTCRPDEKQRYLKKISGPLLDRIDMQTDVLQLSQDELLAAPNGESSAVIRDRVVAARTLQQERFRGTGIRCNSGLSGRELQKWCRVSSAGELLLREAIRRFRMSPRAYDRVLKVARTIADLAGSAELKEEHLFEAVGYRRSKFLNQ